jgi:RNA-directed DNA polymerase
VIEDLNPILRGWGSSFRTGNAARKFRQARGAALRNLMVKKRGRNLRAARSGCGTRAGSTGFGLCRLRGTV